MEKTIFHVDVNSAFLSWSAAYRVSVLGETTDLRDIPSAVAGDKDNRQGIILAKSQPAKKFGVQTGEPIFRAKQKCPGLVIVPPDYSLYVEASRHFTALLRQVAPVVEQYSIDEAWADMTGTEGLYGSPVAAALLCSWKWVRARRSLPSASPASFISLAGSTAFWSLLRFPSLACGRRNLKNLLPIHIR